LLIAALFPSVSVSGQNPVLPVDQGSNEQIASVEDARVFAAVVERLILPRLRTMGNERPALRINTQTVVMCPEPNVGCFTQVDFDYLWGKDGLSRGAIMLGTTRPHPSTIVSDVATRGELVAAMKERNTQTTPLRPFAVGGMRLLFDRESTTEDVRTINVASFSLPGYVDDYALVYAGYMCGMLCGEGWLVVLTKNADGWFVRSAAELWMS
jgi:hypothetical protein